MSKWALVCNRAKKLSSYTLQLLLALHRAKSAWNGEGVFVDMLEVCSINTLTHKNPIFQNFETKTNSKITNYFFGSTAAADETHSTQTKAPSGKIDFSDMAQSFADS